MRARGPDLSETILKAARGTTSDLFRLLELRSGLPGPKMNTELALHFASECVRVEKSEALDLSALLTQMTSLPADEARGASSKEFLVVAGVLASVARAAKRDPKEHERALTMLEERADDLRFRVRDAVPLGLATLGGVMGPPLAERVQPWMDRYFHAAAVLLALSEPEWLERFRDDASAEPLRRLDEAFTLAHDAPRSAARYPGHKALLDALGLAPTALAKRFGIPVFELLEAWAERVKVPELREIISANVRDTSFKRSFAGSIHTVREKVEGSKKPPRDPTRIVHGTRGRGRKRG